MKILKLKIERCGDCKNIECVKNSYNLPSGYWRCKILNERVALQTIPLLCPLEDDAPKTCATCRHWGTQVKPNFLRECLSEEIVHGLDTNYAFLKTGADFGCIHHEVKPCK